MMENIFFFVNVQPSSIIEKISKIYSSNNFVQVYSYSNIERIQKIIFFVSV